MLNAPEGPEPNEEAKTMAHSLGDLERICKLVKRLNDGDSDTIFRIEGEVIVVWWNEIMLGIIREDEGMWDYYPRPIAPMSMEERNEPDATPNG